MSPITSRERKTWQPRKRKKMYSTRPTWNNTHTHTLTMQHQAFTQDEHIVASAVASLASTPRSKHSRDEEDGNAGMKDCKIAKMDILPQPPQPAKKAPGNRVLRPAPFFFYKDFSQEPDKDPFIPLTLPGRVPNFPGWYIMMIVSCGRYHYRCLRFRTPSSVSLIVEFLLCFSLTNSQVACHFEP